LKYYTIARYAPNLPWSLPRTVQGFNAARFARPCKNSAAIFSMAGPRRQELDSQELRQAAVIESVEGRYSNRNTIRWRS